jgi:hypothetical protein
VKVAGRHDKSHEEEQTDSRIHCEADDAEQQHLAKSAKEGQCISDEVELGNLRKSNQHRQLRLQAV